MQLNTKGMESFWAKVDKKSSPNGCWLWTGPLSCGYGRVTVQQKTVGAHRLAWELLRGQIPDGILVCHNCPGGDNRACCNPSHLWLGTNAENINDAKLKGTLATGDRHGSKLHPESRPRGGSQNHREKTPRGVDNGRSKLTELDVLFIRATHLRKRGDGKRLAEKFQVTPMVISRIIRGKSWNHI